MKIRKQLRGFDIAEYIAFKTFPKILNTDIGFYSYTQETYIVDTRTREVVCKICNNIEDCRQLAKQANKLVRDNTKWLEKHNEKH